MGVCGTTARVGSPALMAWIDTQQYEYVIHAINVLKAIDATSVVDVTAVDGYHAERVAAGVTTTKMKTAGLTDKAFIAFIACSSAFR